MGDSLGEASSADWDRARWLAHADRLLDGARAWASANRALITPPGDEGGYGRAVDGLEGFARTFLLAAFRIAGATDAERSDDADGESGGLGELIARYASGVAAGVDATAPDRWVRLDEHPQAKVEAASIALALDLTRPWIWDRLDRATQQAVIDYLSPAVGDDGYPQTNWVWFRIVVETFLRSVDGPWSAGDIAADLARHDSFVRDDGWLADGDHRAFDHYNGWALQLYPVLWSRMLGAGDLAGGRTADDIARLDRFLVDAVALIGGDGSPLIQGRSLIYRFAAAAPFWVGALAEVPSLSPGLLRHAASRIVGHFADHGAPDGRDLLTVGWHDEWRQLAQSYSGPGSPYWAVKGLLGVMLPAAHPVWTAAAEPLPVDAGDDLRAVRAAGWLVSGTAADGIVRVVNHGTDRARAGELVGDSPLYARLGYATAASPLLDDRAWREPLEQSVTLVDGAGRATHRAAMELLDVRVDEAGHRIDDGGRRDHAAVVGVGVATSSWDAHWLTAHPEQQHHGSGVTGDAEVAGRLTVHSLVRGRWELRLVRVDSLTGDVPADQLTLRIGGWAVAAATPPTTETTVGQAVAATSAVTSRITAVSGAADAAVEARRDASPLGAAAAVPYLDVEVAVGAWVAALVELTASPLGPGTADVELGAGQLTATWPDGVVTSHTLVGHRYTDPTTTTPPTD